MKDLRKQVGERINALRRARGLTQNELAEKVALDGRHISRLETGKHYPSLDTLASMAGGAGGGTTGILPVPDDGDRKPDAGCTY